LRSLFGCFATDLEGELHLLEAVAGADHVFLATHFGDLEVGEAEAKLAVAVVLELGKQAVLQRGVEVDEGVHHLGNGDH
jgi:hypothetical protein